MLALMSALYANHIQVHLIPVGPWVSGNFSKKASIQGAHCGCKD